ncbi:MAG: PilZ domain-containing protein, partial [Thermoanaerobaculia bacterium]
MVSKQERRRFPRVTLRPPMLASIGTSRVVVLDASVGGMRVAHHSDLPGPGEYCRVELQSEVGTIILDCEVIRTHPQSSPLASFATALYQSGLHIVAADHQSGERFHVVF